jgi:hypothetical protein
MRSAWVGWVVIMGVLVMGRKKTVVVVVNYRA